MKIKPPTGMLMEVVENHIKEGDYYLDKKEWYILEPHVMTFSADAILRPHPRETAQRQTVKQLTEELAKYKRRAFKLEKLFEMAIEQVDNRHIKGNWDDLFKRAMDDNVATTNFENLNKGKL